MSTAGRFPSAARGPGAGGAVAGGPESHAREGAARGRAPFVLLLVISMVIWGGTWPSGKLISGLAAAEATVFYRFLLTSISMLVVCLIRKERLRLPLRAVVGVLAAAVLMTAYNHFFFGGLEWGLANKGGVIVTCLNPVFTFLVSAVAFRPRLRALELLGLGLGLAGGAVLLEVWRLDPSALVRSGNLFFLGAAACWASLTVVSQAVQRRMGYLAFSFHVYAASTVINAAIVALRGFELQVREPLEYWGNVVYLGVVGTAFATTVYFLASSRLGAHRAGSFIYLVPGFALLLSWIALGEVPTIVTVGGGLVAVSAVALINRARARPAET